MQAIAATLSLVSVKSFDVLLLYTVCCVKKVHSLLNVYMIASWGMWADCHLSFLWDAALKQLKNARCLSFKLSKKQKMDHI